MRTGMAGILLLQWILVGTPPLCYLLALLKKSVLVSKGQSGSINGGENLDNSVVRAAGRN